MKYALYFTMFRDNLVAKWPVLYTANSLKEQSGPSCSKLTTSLVNDSLKFQM